MTPSRTTAPAASLAHKPDLPVGPLEWRWMVVGLQHDGVISAEEAHRTIPRCAQAESSQHPLVRLASVAMERASDGKPFWTLNS